MHIVEENKMTLFFFLLFLPTNLGQLFGTQIISRPEKRHPQSPTCKKNLKPKKQTKKNKR